MQTRGSRFVRFQEMKLQECAIEVRCRRAAPTAAVEKQRNVHPACRCQHSPVYRGSFCSTGRCTRGSHALLAA